MSKELNTGLNVIDKARIKFWQALHLFHGRTYDETQEKIITGYGKVPFDVGVKPGQSREIDGVTLRVDKDGNVFTELPKEGLYSLGL